ncbi:MAG: glycogen/starch synthase, partial [Nanoarchaeota archaeon]
MAWVFEVSWEICNKVGGIYTVVRSKVPYMLEAYKDNYVAVGPYFPKKAAGEFVEEIPPAEFRDAFEKLRQNGIVCRYGKWMIPSKPKTILVDFSSFASQKDRIKNDLWNWFKVDSLGTQYYDFDEPVVWASAVGMLLCELSLPQMVVHCHEWLAASCLLHIKARNAPIATVFTTHATILGRTISSSGEPLYETLGTFDPEQRARQFGIQAKFLLERAAAQNTDVFTTVSEITGLEAEKLLGRKPDVLVLNGLDISGFPSFDESSIKHQLFKRKIKEFIIQYFFPYYKFSLDETMLYFICGRHELRDKGIDVFIKSLGKLNQELISKKSEKTAVVFLWVPGNVKGIRPELIENMTYFKDIHEQLIDESDIIKERLLYDVFMESPIDGKRLLGESSYFSIQKKMLRFKRQGLPPVSTHELFDEGTDDILSCLREARLFNAPSDRVKVIYYPVFLSGADRLLDVGYYEGISGCHLGVFPSYYEPWGYTPLETAALGTCAITTDLAGFGKFIKE